MRTDYKKTKLKNGIRVLTIPFKRTETVTALFFVGTGSHYEEKKLSGVSHYLEHLFFKGSKKYPNPLKISNILDGLGADYNAFTSDEVTAFYVKVVKDKVEIALDVMGDFLEHPLFSPKSIEREKRVILEELHMYHDTPARRVLEIFENILYGNQPAGRAIGGTPESVSAIVRHDVLDYFRKQYRGQNIVVVFAGNISYNKGHALASKYFGGLPEGEGYDKRPVTNVGALGPIVKIERRETDQTHIALGFPGFDLSQKQRYPLAVLGTILGGGMSSRLFTEVREKRGLAYSIRAGDDSGTDYGSFMISGGITNSKLEEAIKVIVNELRRLKRTRVDKWELDKSKSSMEGHMFLGLESSDAVANFWGMQEILMNQAESPQDHMRRIQSVKAQDVQRVANEVFLKDEARLAIIGPVRGKKKFIRLLGRL